MTKSTSTKTVPGKSTSVNFYFLHTFLLITIVLLTAINVYCCFNIDIKNCAYFDDITKIEGFDLGHFKQNFHCCKTIAFYSQ